MSYVEHCDKHGQFHGDYCGGCIEDTQIEVETLRAQLSVQTERISQLEQVLRDILEAGTEDGGDDKKGNPYPWEKYLLYNKDVEYYWSVLRGEQTRKDSAE
jgi:hypothetical protein